MKKFSLFLLCFLCAFVAFAQTAATFENLSLNADTFWNGSDLSGGFNSGLAHFVNHYDTTYFSWSGFSYTNKTDSVTAGYGNQNSAITATGYNGSANYAVGNDYGDAKIILTGAAAGKAISGVYVTNATYTYISMRDGDLFAKKFGGATGADQDWLKLTARGWYNGAPTPSAEFYLADFRSADSTQDYLVNNWRWFNLLPMGNVDSLQFYLTSSDTSQWGMNTPAYFALDNFTTADTINIAPIAANDAVIITYAQDTAINVLANDVDNTGTPLTVTLISQPLITGATATVTVQNEIEYTPAIGIVATDTLWYAVCDAGQLCDTAQLTITVNSLTGIAETGETLIKIVPNPFISQVTITSAESINAVELYDLGGRLLKALNGGLLSTISVPTGELAPGSYMLKIVTGHTVTVKQLIKQ